MNMRSMVFVFGVAAGLWACVARADDPAPPAAPPAAPAPAPARRDPTEPDSHFRAVAPVAPAAPATVAPTEHAATQPPAVLPTFALKGLVIVQGKSGAALVQVEERMIRVQEGAKFSVAVAGGTLELNVVTLSRDGVTIAAPAIGQTVTLR